MSDNIIIDFFDTRAYFDSRGLSYSDEGPNCSPGWVNVDCPWCGDSAKHLGFSLETNVGHCWRCGGKSIAKFVQEIEHCSWSEALAIMEEFQNYSKPGLLEKEGFIPPKDLIWPKGFTSLKDPRVTVKIVDDFLLKRGLDPITTKINHNLYYGGFLGDYRFRIILPVYIRRKLVTFMTRDVTGKAETPYISQPPREAVIPCKHTLYGYDDVAPGGPVVLVEGPIDQWKLGRGSLATWGTGWTMEQVALLRSLHPSKVYILYDSEEIAQDAAKQLSKAIWFCSTEVLYLDDKKDPGELTPEEGQEVMKELIGKWITNV